MSEALECIDGHTGDCSGRVQYHQSLAGTGTAIPRCESHWSKRLRKQEQIDRDYPDSPMPPSWFNPADAGERWDSDY